MKSIPLLSLSLLLLLAPGLVQAALPSADAQGQILPSLAPLIDRVAPAVVNISTFKNTGGGKSRLLPRASGVGSGVIVNAEQGLILSNHHVIAGADKIRIALTDGRSFDALLIGSDPGADLALLKIEADKLIGLTLVDSDQLRVGDFVVAIGNPFGLGQTVTSGIVSALQRTGLGIENYENFIQTDAAINPGNSGGALINLRGDLVGINTAIIAPKGSSVGIGFAIPSNMAKTISMHLAQDGEVSRGALGVSIQELSPELLKAFNAPAAQGGVLVTSVASDSAAAKAGIIVGDIITQINEQSIKGVDHLRSRLGILTLNRNLQISYLRKGEEHQVSAEIRPPVTTTIPAVEKGLEFAGAVLKDAGDDIKGVVVVSFNKGSPLALAGLQTNDVILSVNQLSVNSLEEFTDAVKEDSNLMLLQRGMGTLYLVLE
ncbi:MAG: trypsin-like peptidase domain-containing protein [Motiliproteus sp.]